MADGTQQVAQAPAAPVSQADALDALADNIFGVMNIPEPEPRPRDGQYHDQQGRLRENGRFAKAETVEAEATEDAAEEAPAAKDDAGAAEAEDGEDYIELPPEKEGDQPRREKLTDILARANKAAEVEAELHRVKNEPLVTPEVFDKAMLKAVEAAQQYTAKLDHWMRSFEPQQPHPALRNPNSPHYDPDRYAREFEAYQAQVDTYNRVAAEHQRAAKDLQERQEVLRLAQVNRNRAAVHEFWPELKDVKAAQKVQSDLVAGFGKYGVTPELIDSVDHPAFYALAKYALKGLQAEAVQEQAAKVVQAKPRLIKGQARQPVNPTKSRDDMLKRAEKTGSREDMLAIAEQLLG